MFKELFLKVLGDPCLDNEVIRVALLGFHQVSPVCHVCPVCLGDTHGVPLPWQIVG